MHTIIPYAGALGRLSIGSSFLIWCLLTAMLLNSAVHSRIGRDIRIKGSGESAFITNYSTPTAMTVRQGSVTEQGTSVIYKGPNYRGNTSIGRSIMSTAR